MGERDFRYNDAQMPLSSLQYESLILHLVTDTPSFTPNIHHVLPPEIMLQENSNHVERTIDAIFLMGGGGDSNSATGATMR